MTWREPSVCVLCGNTANVRNGLVQWADALPGMRYEHVARCVDREACRARVQSEGKPWPVVERNVA